MPRFQQRWRHFWFEPGSATNLALCRILFFGLLALFYLPRQFAGWADVSAVFWYPMPLFSVLRLPVLPSELLVVLQTVWKLALVAACVGLSTRLSTGLACILGVYLLGLPHNFGKLHHNDGLVVLLLSIMMLSRCGDALSVDAIWRSRRPLRLASGSDAGDRGEYTWPIRLAWVTMALVFLSAGLAKLQHSGFAWVFSDNLASLLSEAPYRSFGEPILNWGPFIAQQQWLTQPLALATIVLEVGYVTAVISRAARLIFVPGMIVMLLGIQLVLGPRFEPFLICHVFWVRWDLLLQSFVKKAAPRRAALYSRVLGS